MESSKRFLAVAVFLASVFIWSNAATVQADEFVGSASCIQCHQGEYDDWLESDHRKAMQPANEKNVLGNFENVSVTFHGIETRFFRQGNDFKVATTGQNGKPDVFTVKYSFGHYPLQQYLIDTGSGHLQALNLAWDSRSTDQGGQRWYHLQASEKIDSEHPLFWTRHFQNANSRCIECHNTDVRKNFISNNSSYASSWSETGVGCEACHGPASQHLVLATTNELSDENSGFDKQKMPQLSWAFRGNDSIASPSGNQNNAHIDTCGGCHSRRSLLGKEQPRSAFHDQYRLSLLDQGLYFADGQIDDEVFVMGSFLQSKMHAQGVTCSNCHNVHSGKLIADGNALCAQCHKPARFDSSDHHRHQAGTAGAQCVNCHMPERLYMSVDLRRDHSFSIPDPQLSQRSNSPNACTGCHQGRTDEWASQAINAWGAPERQNIWAEINQGLDQLDALMFRDYARYSSELELNPIQQATLISKLAGFPSQLALDTAAQQLNNPDPLIRRAAVTALRSMPVQLRWQWLSPLIDDPVKSVRLEVASVLADAANQLEGEDAAHLEILIEEYRQSLEYHADSPAGQLSIGNLEASLGYSILAENAYLRSLEIEPHYVPTLINLADLYRSSGRDHESRDVLLHALQVAPDSANTHHAYALFLVRTGKQNEALAYLETAIKQQDSTPRHIYVYAVALDSRGDTGMAIKVIAEASKRWPNNLELSFLQVSYMDKIGDIKGIHRYLSLLASVASQVPQVKAWTSKYGANVNQ